MNEKKFCSFCNLITDKIKTKEQLYEKEKAFCDSNFFWFKVLLI